MRMWEKGSSSILLLGMCSRSEISVGVPPKTKNAMTMYVIHLGYLLLPEGAEFGIQRDLCVCVISHYSQEPSSESAQGPSSR